MSPTPNEPADGQIFQGPTEEPAGPPSEAVAHVIPATTGEVVGSAPGEYLGATVRETTGSAVAKIVLYDNLTAATGNIVDEIELAAGASTPEGGISHRGDGRQVVNGLWAVITGAVQGSVFQ